MCSFPCFWPATRTKDEGLISISQISSASARVRSNLEAICKSMVGSYLRSAFWTGRNWWRLIFSHVTCAQPVFFSSPSVGRRLCFFTSSRCRCRFATGQQWLPATWVWLVLWWTLCAARMQPLEACVVTIFCLPKWSHGLWQGRALVIFVPCSVRSIFVTLLQFDPCVYVLWWRNGRKVEAGQPCKHRKWYAAQSKTFHPSGNEANAPQQRVGTGRCTAQYFKDRFQLQPKVAERRKEVEWGWLKCYSNIFSKSF